MRVALDISPLVNSRRLQHRVRGTGFYIENLKKSLIKYYPNNTYEFFDRREELTKDIDLVHYPYFEPFFLTLPLFHKTKLVVTVHDLTPLVFPKYFPAGIKGMVKWQLQKIALKRASAIITDSESSKRDIIEKTGISASKIHVVYLAAGEEFKKLKLSDKRIIEVKKKFNLPEKFVLYVGDATWNKNIPRLIEATTKINLPLVLVGKALADENFDKTNPWNRDLMYIRSLIKNNNLVFNLGFVQTSDLVVIYNIATVFAMPSLYEGFGLPIVEAMSCGCPVVTSREGSIPEIAGDAVYYVNPYDKDNIAEGINKIFANVRLQEDFSHRGIKRAKNFNWKKTSGNTLESV